MLIQEGCCNQIRVVAPQNDFQFRGSFICNGKSHEDKVDIPPRNGAGIIIVKTAGKHLLLLPE